MSSPSILPTIPASEVVTLHLSPHSQDLTPWCTCSCSCCCCSSSSCSSSSPPPAPLPPLLLQDLTPWCTCFGSLVCSYYAERFNDGTRTCPLSFSPLPRPIVARPPILSFSPSLLSSPSATLSRSCARGTRGNPEYVSKLVLFPERHQVHLWSWDHS